MAEEFHLDYTDKWRNEVTPLLEKIKNFLDEKYTSMIISHINESTKQELKLPNLGEPEKILYIKFDLKSNKQNKITYHKDVIIYFDMRPDLQVFPKIFSKSISIHMAFDSLPTLDSMLKRSNISRRIK